MGGAEHYSTMSDNQTATNPQMTLSQSSLDPYRILIEEILNDLGIDPAKNAEVAQDNRLSWFLQRGSASIFVEVFQEGDDSYFMIDCPLLMMPAVGLEAFFRKLLELNDRLVEASFVARGQEIHLVGIRPLRGLDAVEASGMMDRISSWADTLDNQLAEEFGAPLWES